MNRPRYSVFIATSIDGYIARQDGDVSWLEQVNLPNEDYGYGKFFNSIDTIVMGRHSYEKVINFEPWPYVGKKVIVLSKTLTSVEKDVELFNSSLTELNAKLFYEGRKHIYVDGGNTISQFLNLKFIDQMTISIVPILLGSGIRLFSEIFSEAKCKLVSSKEFSSGLIQLKYDVLYN